LESACYIGADSHCVSFGIQMKKMQLIKSIGEGIPVEGEQ
jgi:hypothetical protein